jgi:4-amino-4-deoxy-L-arabinose transferase-like glycosyltransferase
MVDTPSADGSCPQPRTDRLHSQAAAPVRTAAKWTEGRSGALLAALCATLALAGAVYCVGLGPELRFYDERDYLTLADNLADKGRFSFDGVHPTAGRPPAWPVFLAGLRAAGLSVEMLRMVNIGLYIGCVVLLYRMLKRSHSGTVGFTAALLCGFYALFFYTSATLYPQMFQAFLLLGFITLLFEAGAASGRRRVVAGVCAGVLILTVPVLIAVLPLLVVLAPGSRRDRVVTGGVVALVVAVMVGGWTVRNYQAFGSLISSPPTGGTTSCSETRRTPGRAGV